MKKLYFLFSREGFLVDTYYNMAFEQVIIEIEEGIDQEFQVISYTLGSEEQLDNLLETAQSWHVYATITKEEYEQLKKLQDEI